MSSTSDEVGHTATPWSAKRAHHPTDGEYDYAISAVFDGRPKVIAEVFGRVAEDIKPNAEANAAFIVNAVNSHDSLVKALERIASPKLREPKRSDYSSDDSYWEACGAWRMALIARAALSQAKGGK